MASIKNVKINGAKTVCTKKELKERISRKLLSRGIGDPCEAGNEELYVATAGVLKEIMIKSRENFKRRIKATGTKKICYLCMEFLVGRSLKTDAEALGVLPSLESILSDFGKSIDDVYMAEVDPGLGNGGLGRLAACFMDSLSDLDYAANGYSLLYETGLFKQKILGMEQVELPDEWVSRATPRLVAHPERSVYVRFGGKINESWNDGILKIENYEYDEVQAVPYDLLIPGVDTDAVNTIRLWKAKSARADNVSVRDSAGFLRSADENAAVITRQLYPKDDHDEGKLLRLSQQYFLVSASLQSIISDYLADHGTLDGFSDNIAIHINDTHPALSIPELMRILMDVYSYSWDDAWATVIKTVTYTNHTVLPEALESWRVDLFSMKLPRIFMIVNEINRRFTKDLWTLYPGDWDRISRMSIIAYNQVRMANLSVVGSHRVNGVSKLHSNILKNTVFHDFYKMDPWKFTNVTNGVIHRRWINISNPGLASLLDELIGKEYRKEPEKLVSFEKYKDDKDVTARLSEIKKANKERFAAYAYQKSGIKIDPSSIFDVQIKRMHEYKRQLMNLMKIIAISNEVINDPNIEIQPQTFIFGCKAAPGYVMAKKLIKLILAISEEIRKDRRLSEKISVFFLEDYNVSSAEMLIPSADISEQISLAGKEASGTGCMKLMMNGALTLGTLDGANVEIMDTVGKENIYIFGLNAKEVDELWKNGYDARGLYHSSALLKETVDRFEKPIGGEDFSFIVDYLLYGSHSVSDPFMCLADLTSYLGTYKRILYDYSDGFEWNKKSLINIARSGIFSSNNSIKKYADEIWNIRPVKSIES